MDLLNKKILLIALPNYSKEIIKHLESVGSIVSYIPDKPNEGFISKTLGRLNFLPYIYLLDNYYERQLNKLSGSHFDFILVIRGEYTTKRALLKIKNLFKNSKLILYMWDSIRLYKNIKSKWIYFDKVWTFDRIDYLNNKQFINFLPLFYFNSFTNLNKSTNKYDLAFIGTGHIDRVKIIKQIQSISKSLNYSTYFYIYLPHKFIFYLNKLFNKHYKDVSINDINFSRLSIEEVYSVYSKSKCVIDIESPYQNGLTMRTIEILGLRKKIITTNRDIINYDFYNSENVSIIDRKNIKLDQNFIKSDYKILSNKIYSKYSLVSWLHSIFIV